MANPRAQILNYDGLDQHGTTYATDSSIVFTQSPASGVNRSAQIGLAVTLVAGMQVGLGSTTNPLYGKLLNVEADGFGTVQDRGFMQLAYPANDGTAPVLNGYVVVNGAGKVINTATFNRTHVVSVDTVNLLCIVKLLG